MFIIQYINRAWVSPTFTGRSALTGYKVYMKNALLTTLAASALTYTASNLANGVSYDFNDVAVTS